MYLQLAERKRGKVNVSSYKRKSSVASHSRRYPLNENGQQDNPYIFIPNFESGGGIYVREDKFDSLPDSQWGMFMKNLAPFQPEVQNQSLSEPMFLAGRAERKANRSRRKEAKTAKKEAKTEEKFARTERRGERQDRRSKRAESRETRKAEGKGFDFDKAKEFGGSLIDRFTKRGEGEGGGGDGGGAETPFYKKPLVIGGLLVVAVAGVLYVVSQNKKSASTPSMLTV